MSYLGAVGIVGRPDPLCAWQSVQRGRVARLCAQSGAASLSQAKRQRAIRGLEVLRIQKQVIVLPVWVQVCILERLAALMVAARLRIRSLPASTVSM